MADIELIKFIDDPNDNQNINDIFENMNELENSLNSKTYLYACLLSNLLSLEDERLIYTNEIIKKYKHHYMLDYNNNLDLVISVLFSRSHIYDKLVEIYWIPLIENIKKNYNNIKIIFICDSDTDTSNISDYNDNIFRSNSDTSLIPGILIKTIELFEHVNNNYNYNFILRTNISSMFIIEKIMKLINTLSINNTYTGILGNHNNINFVSGACIIISKDCTEELIENKNNLNYSILDDLAIANILSYKAKPINNRYDICDCIDYLTSEQLNKHYLNIINNNFSHIRIKNNNRLIDIQIFEYLSNKLNIS